MNQPRPHSSASEKPFIEHLEELRVVLLKSACVLIVATCAGFFAAPQIIKVLIWPLERVVPAGEGGLAGLGLLRTLRPAGGFMIGLKAAFLSGVIVSLPFVFYFLAGFIIPGLTKRERKVIVPAFTFATMLFVAGMAFCYFLVLPVALRFFWGYSEGLGIRNDWIIENYISFVVQFLVAFGVVFELPCVILGLVKAGVLTPQMLRGKRKHAIVGAFIVAAVVTPTPDIITQVLVGIPLVLLYEACIWLSS